MRLDPVYETITKHPVYETVSIPIKRNGHITLG